MAITDFRNDSDAPDIQVSAVEATIGALVAAWNSHDAEAFASQFTPDAELVPWFGALVVGRDRVAESHRYAFTLLHTRTLKTVVENRVRQVGPHAVSVRTESELRGTEDDHSAPQERMRERYLMVMRLVDDRWLIAEAQNTYVSDYPGDRPSWDDGAQQTGAESVPSIS